MRHFIVDCDGVLLDWIGGFRRFMHCHHGHVVPAAYPHEQCLEKWSNLNRGTLHQMIRQFNTSAHFDGLRPYNDAQSGLREMRRIGHVTVLSACGDAHVTHYHRAKNLQQCFGLSSGDLVCLPLGHSKFDFLWEFTRNRDPRTVVLIEDSFGQARAGVVNGVTSYCIRRPWNRGDELNHPETDVIWADSLSEITLAFRTANQLNVD